MKKTIIQFCIVSILALSAAPGALARKTTPGCWRFLADGSPVYSVPTRLDRKAARLIPLPLKICLRRRNSLLFWWSVTPMTAKFGSVIMFQKRRGHNSQSVIRHRYPMLSAATNPCPANWAWAVKSLLSSKQAPKKPELPQWFIRQNPGQLCNRIGGFKIGDCGKNGTV